MKRNTKRTVKAAKPDPLLSLGDPFPMGTEVGEEHSTHLLGEDEVFHQDEEAEDAPAADEVAPVAAEGEAARTRTRPTMRWACTCARWAPSRC